MPRIICRTYGVGIFAGVTFTEQDIDGKHVGVGHTDDEQALAWFRARPGFDVEGPVPAPKPAGPKALKDHTNDELRAIAAEREIDLKGATKKDDLVAAIETAAEGSAGDTAPPAGSDEKPPAGKDDAPPAGDEKPPAA